MYVYSCRGTVVVQADANGTLSTIPVQFIIPSYCPSLERLEHISHSLLFIPFVP